MKHFFRGLIAFVIVLAGIGSGIAAYYTNTSESSLGFAILALILIGMAISMVMQD